MLIKLQLRVIKTSIPVVLGYPFLTKYQPHIDWKRFVRIYEIQALPAADSFRITASTSGVMEVEWDMLQVHSVVTENSAVKSEGMSLKEVGHSADGVEVSRGSDSADANSGCGCGLGVQR